MILLAEMLCKRLCHSPRRPQAILEEMEASKLLDKELGDLGSTAQTLSTVILTIFREFLFIPFLYGVSGLPIETQSGVWKSSEEPCHWAKRDSSFIGKASSRNRSFIFERQLRIFWRILTPTKWFWGKREGAVYIIQGFEFVGETLQYCVSLTIRMLRAVFLRAACYDRNHSVDLLLKTLQETVLLLLLQLVPCYLRWGHYLYRNVGCYSQHPASSQGFEQ